MSSIIDIRKVDQTLEEAFPKANAGWKPFGDRVLVQLRTPKRTSAGGIALPEESRDFEKWSTTVGKVIALGPLAFRDRRTMEPWAEGIWAKPGDYVRCPKWGGDRWEVGLGKNEFDTVNVARFVVFRDHELIGGLEEGDNPLRFRDYV